MNDHHRNLSLHTDPVFAQATAEVAKLDQARKVLCYKIKEIENRLRFGYSEPLNDYRIELMKEDMALICEMTNLLVG